MPRTSASPLCSVCAAPRGPGSARGLCARCYKAQQRGRTPSPEHQRAAAGEGGQISIRFTRATLELIRQAGELEGVTPLEYIRWATLEWLARSLSEAE